MDTKQTKITGLRLEIPQGTNEGVAIDELIDDLLHGDVRGALRALHELVESDEEKAAAAAAAVAGKGRTVVVTRTVTTTARIEE
ncbi:hypothetical protein JD292_11420 [Leucobacter sp. CSA2]|uniref:Uncharacterized protein n=1 Tax=Leucobacter edaphi TaxID=2796472 RepID=A0A934QDK6_9MICO|nr:hypothetical protein [Leucobacter edaphi]MBK0422681.1 hypothetical protein [Leucobacter edaphi]